MSNVTTLAKGLGPLPRPSPKPASNILDLFSLKGKVASITGSGGGIGYAVAEAYAQAGANVALWYNSNPSAVEKAKALAEKYNIKAIAYKCKITDEKAVKDTIEQQLKDFGGKIDVFVANAGVTWTAGDLIDVEDSEAFRKVIDVNINGVYYTAKTIGRIFKKQGFGSYIITASMSAHAVNIPQSQAVYNLSKAGVIQLAKSLAIEWSGFARVNTVSPGYINTEITKFASQEMKERWWSYTPLGREGETQELVGAYLYLASNASSFTTGTDIVVDGGYSIV